MSFAVFLLVLVGAALHASWNVVVKRGDDTARMSVLVATTAAAISAAGIVFVEAPAPASWPFAAGSVALQVVYWVAIANAYRIADMSQAYPLMRGTAPLLVAMVSITAFGDVLTTTAWAGVSLVSAGIAAMTLGGGRGGDARGVVVALATAVVIAAYTIVDGIGVRRSGSPIGYTLWIFLLTAVPLLGWELSRDPRRSLAFARSNLGLGLFGGFGTLASYGIALWAMAQAPVAVVAALRETSILFGTVIAVVVLKERVDRRRLAAVGLIALGAAVLRAA